MNKAVILLLTIIVDILVSTLFILPSIILTILKIFDIWETWAFNYLKELKDE